MLSNKAASIEARITGIKGLLQPLIEDATDDEQLRKQLHGLFQGLITTLETPSDAIWRMIMQVGMSLPKLEVNSHFQPISSLLKVHV